MSAQATTTIPGYTSMMATHLIFFLESGQAQRLSHPMSGLMPTGFTGYTLGTETNFFLTKICSHPSSVLNPLSTSPTICTAQQTERPPVDSFRYLQTNLQDEKLRRCSSARRSADVESHGSSIQSRAMQIRFRFEQTRLVKLETTS